MNYKKTLNLPHTIFPMKANLIIKEPHFLDKWESTKLYENIIKKLKNKKNFTLHDGPPYANGHIHIGTAMNKILKDIIIRSRQMLGYKAEYVPGWDCHGLPIEHNVDKKLGSKKKNMTKSQIRHYCKEYAKKFVDIHKNEFKRLGIMGTWDNPYLTMDYQYEATIAKECCNFAKNGTLYKSKKPIHWCCNCNTALAEAEIEYKNEVSTSVYVKFKIKTANTIFSELKDKNVYIIIWTTTPWTLPANLAIALHTKNTYAAIDTLNNEVFILAKNLTKKCMTKFNINKYKILFEFLPEKIKNMNCIHPFYEQNSLIITGEHVNTDTGTGCVHIAPGHGREDFEIGEKHKLKPYCPVNKYGIFTKEVKKLSGIFIFDANSIILKELSDNNNLVAKEKITHSYPHCWRCNKPIIFRATSQWFISMEKTELRKKALNAISNVKWIPSWGQNRLYKMLENRPDWCISRQRIWGVPITIFCCEKCKAIYINDDIISRIFSLFNKYGANIWFDENINTLILKNAICKKCGNNKFIKEKDILDVWFDSGVSHSAVLQNRTNLNFPADLYIEGTDQHRGWFQSSLLTSVESNNIAPYKSVLTHGFVVDAKGKKMSKSLGNVISPNNIINKYGAEILRIWVAASNYKDDIKISDSILKQFTDTYKKVRNTCRFLLGNLYDFDPLKNKIKYSKMLGIDRYALHLLQNVIKKTSLAYKTYDFHIVYHTLVEYCTSNLSSFYLDILKDRLYTSFSDSFERRSAQTTVYEILNTICRIMAPIFIFTAEEIWEHIPKNENKSVHLSDFPKINHKQLDWDLSKKWEILLSLKPKITHALEEARANKIIGHSLESSISINFLEKSDTYKTFLEYKKELKTIFIVSNVEINNSKIKNTYTQNKIHKTIIKVSKSKNKKCQRCWIHDDSVGKKHTHLDLCKRCEIIIKQIAENKQSQL